MRRSLTAALTLACLAPVAWATSASASDSQPVCAFTQGSTTCATTTSAPVADDVAPGSRPGCTVVTPVTAVTTTYTAQRGQPRSSGAALPAPAPAVVYQRGTPVEHCVAQATPTLTSAWSRASDGSLFFVYQLHGFVPDAPVQIVVTFTNTSQTQTFSRTITTFSNGAFETGDQFHCEYQKGISVTVTQGQTVLTTSGTGADAGACGA